jgi:hypothetical protein
MAKRPRYQKTNLSCPSIVAGVREQLGLRLEAQLGPSTCLVAPILAASPPESANSLIAYVRHMLGGLAS